MAEYLYPGIYVEEKKSGQTAMQGVSSSTGAFVGYAPRGKRGEAVLVTSWEDYKNQFSFGLPSAFMANAYLSYQVYGFFQNGGTKAYIVQPTGGAKATISAGTGVTFDAKEEGTWGNKITAVVTGSSAPFAVEVKYNGVTMEKFTGVTLDNTSDNYIETVINDVSNFIKVTVATTPTLTAGTKVLAGGTDGLPVADTALVDALTAFDTIQTINLLVVAESQTQAVITGALAYAENRKDCYFIADGGLNDTHASIQTFKSNFSSGFGAMYYPWIEVADPIAKTGKRTKFVPVAGHVAGAIARNDGERGVFKAPAGTQVRILGALSAKTKINDVQQGILNPLGINVIRSFPDTGLVVWGARGMDNSYINVRRELLFVMDTIYHSTRWAAFEPNNHDLWRRIRTQIEGFLEDRWKQGAYFGEKREQAFMVKCDEELNTQAVRDMGRVYTDVGIAINKPGEFIIFRVGQWDGGGFVG